jgi:hypothetical protein
MGTALLLPMIRSLTSEAANSLTVLLERVIPRGVPEFGVSIEAPVPWKRPTTSESRSSPHRVHRILCQARLTGPALFQNQRMQFVDEAALWHLGPIRSGGSISPSPAAERTFIPAAFTAHRRASLKERMKRAHGIERQSTENPRPLTASARCFLKHGRIVPADRSPPSAIRTGRTRDQPRQKLSNPTILSESFREVSRDHPIPGCGGIPISAIVGIILRRCAQLFSSWNERQLTLFNSREQFRNGPLDRLAGFTCILFRFASPDPNYSKLMQLR